MTAQALAPTAPPAKQSGRWRPWMAVWAPAVLVTLLNAVKPLHVDDTAYYYFARQLAHHPLDPYGFRIFWYEGPEPAGHVLAPPALPYWWSLAIRWFGERPFLWKLWLLPFPLLLAGALFVLGRRFAPGLEAMLVAMTLLSPGFLPSLNLMLDLPALALSLGAVALFLRACERGSAGLALAAGLMAGVGMETKYTAFLAPATMLLYTLLFGRLRLGVLAAAVAAFFFAGAETLLFLQYGESHFLYHLRHDESLLKDRLLLVLPVLSYLGGTAPAWMLFGLAALRLRPRILAGAGILVLLGYLLVASVPRPFAGYRWHWGPYSEEIRVAEVVFGAIGIATCLVGLAVLHRLGSLSRGRWQQPAYGRRHRSEAFLILWLALELAGYFVLSPFAAVRRLMGVVVVATLLAGRLASRTCRDRPRQALLRAIVLGGVCLGVGFYAVDLLDAGAEKEAAEGAARLLAGKPGTVWFVGHWGFQYYAERAGMKPLAPGSSRLHRGDWLIVPGKILNQQPVRISPEMLELRGRLAIADGLPLRAAPGFYGGWRPLDHRDGPRLMVAIYRVTADSTLARAPEPTGLVSDEP